MAKVYTLSDYRLKKELKILQQQLLTRLEYCDKNGYRLFDHYAIKEISDRIDVLKEKIRNEQEGSS